MAAASELSHVKHLAQSLPQNKCSETPAFLDIEIIRPVQKQSAGAPSAGSLLHIQTLAQEASARNHFINHYFGGLEYLKTTCFCH